MHRTRRNYKLAAYNSQAGEINTAFILSYRTRRFLLIILNLPRAGIIGVRPPHISFENLLFLHSRSIHLNFSADCFIFVFKQSYRPLPLPLQPIAFQNPLVSFLKFARLQYLQLLSVVRQTFFLDEKNQNEAVPQ